MFRLSFFVQVCDPFTFSTVRPLSVFTVLRAEPGRIVSAGVWGFGPSPARRGPSYS